MWHCFSAVAYLIQVLTIQVKFDFETTCGEVSLLMYIKFTRSRNYKLYYLIHSFQELCRHLQVRWQDQWSVQNQPWWFGRIWSLLWPKNSRWRMDSISKETRWLCRFLPSLGLLQTRFWQSERRVLAWTGQDSPPDCEQQWKASCWLGRHSWYNSICRIQLVFCGKWKCEIPAELGKLYRWAYLYEIFVTF